MSFSSWNAKLWNRYALIFCDLTGKFKYVPCYPKWSNYFCPFNFSMLRWLWLNVYRESRDLHAWVHVWCDKVLKTYLVAFVDNFFTFPHIENVSLILYVFNFLPLTLIDKAFVRKLEIPFSYETIEKMSWKVCLLSLTASASKVLKYEVWFSTSLFILSWHHAASASNDPFFS